MWQPEYIKIVGIASYKEATYNFENNKARLIQGINLYDKGQKSNGSGKSILLEGLSLALIGENIRKVRLVDLIDFEAQEDHYVKFVMINSISKVKIEIKREFFEKRAPKITIIENDDYENPVKKSGIGEYNNYILNDLIGISKEDLFNYFIVQKDNYLSFFSVGDEKKKLVISRFSGANLIDGIDKDFDTSIQLEEGKIVEIEKCISKEEGKIEVYNKELEKLKIYNEEEEIKVFEENKKQQLEDVNIKISKKKHAIIDLNLKKAYNSSLSDIYKDRVDNLVDIFTPILEEIKEDVKITKEEEVEILNKQKLKNNEKRKVEIIIAELEQILLGEIECPKCNHKFFAEGVLCSYTPETAKKSLKEEQDKLSTIKIELVKIESEYKELEEILSNIEIDKKYIDNKIVQFDNVKKELAKRLRQFSADYETCCQDIKNFDKQIISFNLELKQINESEFKPIIVDNKKKETEENIIKTNKQIELYETEIVKKEEEIGNYEKYKYVYKRFKTHLANKTIKSIEGFTNYYLQKFKSDMLVLIEGYKLLADNKTIREEILIKMIREKERKFDSFSQGEKTRAIVANILALQKLINLSCHSGGLNLLILDEVDGSLDIEGLMNMMFCLEKVVQNINVITLNSLPNIYPHVIGVCKDKEGKSSYIYNKTEINQLLEHSNSN